MKECWINVYKRRDGGVHQGCPLGRYDDSVRLAGCFGPHSRQRPVYRIHVRLKTEKRA